MLRPIKGYSFVSVQIVFPQIHRPNFVCAHCLENNITCQCGGLKGQDYIMLGLPPMPLQPTRVERLARWAALVSVHPEGFNFDSKHFIQDMVNRNLLFTLATVRLKTWSNLICTLTEHRGF